MITLISHVFVDIKCKASKGVYVTILNIILSHVNLPSLSSGRSISEPRYKFLLTNGPPAEKRDLMTNSENLKIMYILQILSVKSNSWKFQWFIIKDKGTTCF